MQLATVYIALILFIVTFFYLSRRSKKRMGQSLSFKAWFQQLMGIQQHANPRPVSKAHQSVTDATNDDYQDILDVVNDIYRDVHTASDQLRTEVFQKLSEDYQRLERDLQSLRQQLDELKRSRLVPSPPISDEGPIAVQNVVGDTVTKHVSEPPNLVPSSKESRVVVGQDPVYFQILDLLQTGTTPKEIAKNLGITVSEVQVVERLMRPV